MDTPTIEELRLAAACCLSGDGTELERWQLAKVAEWLDDLPMLGNCAMQPLNL